MSSTFDPPSKTMDAPKKPAPTVFEIEIRRVPQTASKREVVHAIAAVLHSRQFYPKAYSSDPLKRLNFDVRLESIGGGSLRHKGIGILSLPWDKIGQHFLHYVRSHPITVNGSRPIQFSPAYPDKDEDEGTRGRRHKLAKTLRKTYYVDPILEETRLQILHDLEPRISIYAVHFGRFYKSTGATNRSYSIEWEHRRDEQAPESMRFDYDKKAICIQVRSSTLSC